MKRAFRIVLCASACLLTACAGKPRGAGAEDTALDDPTAASLYELPLSLTAQDGRAFALSDSRGQPVLLSMFYGSCPQACPMLISDIKAIEKQLDAPTRARLRVILVSLDPVLDTPETLRVLARKHGVDLTRWTFASAPEADVRTLAAGLGLKYRRLPDGGFHHSSLITLLDGRGAIVSRIEGLQQPSEELRSRATKLAGRR